LKRRGELEVFMTWWNHEAPDESWARRYALDGQRGSLGDQFRLVQEYLQVSCEVDSAEQRAAERARLRKRTNRYFAINGFLVVVSVSVVGLLIWQKTENDISKSRMTAFAAGEALRFLGPAKALVPIMEMNKSLPELPEVQRVGYRALAQLRELRVLQEAREDGRAAPIQSVQFAPEPPGLPKLPILLTTANDGYIRFWDTLDGTLVDRYFVAGGRFLSARWSPDRKRLLVSPRDELA